MLILDEPTSWLTETEVSVLFDVMRRLKSEGTSIVYVSHRFEELYAVCDRCHRHGRNLSRRGSGERVSDASRCTFTRACHQLSQMTEAAR
ncbi:hypothetical protein [Nostoc sp.]|uniref:hypothetical protein n=1 Tax=Nostoc sp. TaxID=1180 RepID=UPI002FFA50C1